jgi:type II secretory pathway component PulF
MPKFKYQAITEGGSSVNGVVEADSMESARDMVAARGLIPSKVTPEGAGEIDFIKKIEDKLSKVKVPEIILFTKQFRTLFNAGISIVNLLEVLEQQSENPKLKRAVIAIGDDIKQGSTLFAAFSKHQGIFSSLYCSMLKAGEISGTLPEVLERLIYLIEHEYKVKKQIQSAMVYPIIVVVLLLGAFLFLLNFVIPKFVNIFSRAQIELPLPTKVCMYMYEALQAYWYAALIIVVSVTVAIVLYVRTDKGRFVKDSMLLKMPLVGTVFRKGAMARFASIFSLLQSSGVSILETVTILASTIGNEAISQEFQHLKEKLQEGRGISGPLRNSRNFTPMVINMIAIGEESGNLDDMLKQVASHYDYEVEYSVNRMSELIGPILMCCLAVVVGFFAAAILFPMFDLTKTVK